MRDGIGSDVAVLGGSAEARALMAALGPSARLWQPARDRVTGQATTSEDSFGAWLDGAALLVIASHPCDSDAARQAAQAAAAAGIPQISLVRPAWRPTRRDRWIDARNVAEAARMIPDGARVLVTLGRPALAELRAARQATCFVRQLSLHGEPCPLPRGRFLHGVPPFTVAQEVALMRRYRIDTVLTRNAGGPGGFPKIAAARALHLPVIMVARPRPAPGPVVSSVDAALRWIRERTWLDA